MKTLTCTITVVMTLALSGVYAQEADYSKAIAYGQSFKSRLQYLDKGLKDKKVQLASAWAKDGMSKYVTFFTDYEAVAAAAAQAKQEMREFTAEDAKKLPLTGLIFAHVEVLARGMLPTKKLSKRYVQNAAHLVLEVDGKVIQPLRKELTKVSDASVMIPVGFYTYWQSNSFSLLTGGPLGVEGAKAEMEFAYSVDPSIRTKKGKVILIDAEGNKHQENVDFGKLFQ
jgi:hypothetical protein